MNEKKCIKKDAMQRRSFLKWTGAALAGITFPFNTTSSNAQSEGDPISGGGRNFWKVNPENGEEFFQQKVVNASQVTEKNIIWAKVDGWWQPFQLTEYDQDFLDWYVNDTIDWFDRIFSGQPIANGAHHAPSIATYSRRGIGRKDSSFHLNNAIKSVTILPKEENLDEYISVYEQKIYDNSGPYSLDWKFERLQDDDYWDRRLLGATDLYSGQNFVQENFGYKESHFLLNTMTNPVANILYLDSWTNDAAPTWEMRGIIKNTHWNDPSADELYKKYLKAVLLPHELQHGGGFNFIGVVFHLVEQFDNKDSNSSPGRGQRVSPNFTYPYLSTAEYIYKKLVGKV